MVIILNWSLYWLSIDVIVEYCLWFIICVLRCLINLGIYFEFRFVSIIIL